jgi:uncharacterized membrane protein YbhN (UPF0104 family)
MANGGDPKRFGEAAKYSAALAIIFFAFYFLRKKLGDVTWEQISTGIQSISTSQLLLALLLTIFNFIVLTGYDWIAIRYLKKDLSWKRIMTGAVIGYASSNVFGWLFGGTAVRYFLYKSWGFQVFEIVAFVSILSLTFWLGMFMLAGVAFVALPVRLPEEYADALFLEPHILGWIFLSVVVLYLLACTFLRKPIRWRDKQFSLPPLKLSIMQLLVSAGDFLIASMVLYVLLPHQGINFSTCLVAYLAAMIVVVTVHAPGGIGVLEVVVIYMLANGDSTEESKTLKVAVISGLLLFRLIYYILPAIVAGILFMWHLARMKKRQAEADTVSDAGAA